MQATAQLLILDGHGLLYRAFHAMPAMATSGGIETGAVFGVVRMLRALTRRWEATHRVVVFDGGLPAARLALVEDYKAQRPAMPDALRGQIPLVERYLGAAGIVTLREEAQEADDVMATVARAAVQDGRMNRVYVASSDKDMLQLVDDVVRVVPMSGSGVALDAKGVVARLGVRPEQVCDWLALVGDVADNIGGVPGIGKKTAADLLGRFGSCENLFARLAELKSARLGETLREHQAIVKRNQAMVRLNSALPAVQLDWDALAVGPGDCGAQVALFREWEMTQLEREMAQPELL